MRSNIVIGRLVVAAKTVQVWYDYDAERPTPLSEPTKALLAVPLPDVWRG
jgi:acyl-CoA thioesterase FadM